MFINLAVNFLRHRHGYKLFSTMSDKLKVVVFMGSVREGRLCDRVTTFVKNGLEQRGCFEVETFDPAAMPFEVVRKPLHFYADPSQAPDWLKEANEKIKNTDGFIVVSPEYNATIPPTLSNMMDHFPPASYKYKPTGIVTYSVSNLGGARAGVALRPLLSELGTPSVPASVIIGSANKSLSEDGKTDNETLQGRLNSFLDDFQFYATAIKNQREASGSVKS